MKEKTSGKEAYSIVSSPFATMPWHRSSQTYRISEWEDFLRSRWFKHLTQDEINMCTSEKRVGFKATQNGLALLLPSQMALDKLLNFPESQLPQMKNEESNVQRL